MASGGLDLAALPTPQSITLLLKHHKSTTLLSVQPTSTFDDIKVLLLAALESRGASDLPRSPAHLELGVLADRRDASKGWMPLHLRAQEIAAGKNARKAVAGKKSVSTGTVESAGLVDGSWVAWRGRNNGVNNESVNVDEDGDAVVVDLDDADDEVDQRWDVVIPRYEDDET